MRCGCPSRAPRSAVVTAVIGMAHALGLDVVAEGVESADHLRELAALDCDVGQGYLWSPAVPFAELGRWLQESRR